MRAVIVLQWTVSDFLSFLIKELSLSPVFGYQAGEPRTEKMPMDQDWTAVYPTATPFRPNVVPLPVRMGYPVKGGVPPGKKGNLELIKVRLLI